MPELPEVETIRRGLNKFIIKQKITHTEILCEKSFIGQPIIGTVKAIRRFGKALIIDLDNQKSLMIHLRMTGQLIYDSKDKDRYAAGHPSENFTANLPNKQTRVIIHFNTGTLYFNDQRKFGFIKVLPTTEVAEDAFIKKLAKEPWDMSPEEFYDKLAVWSVDGQLPVDQVGIIAYAFCTAMADGITGETIVVDGGASHNIVRYQPAIDAYPED